MYIRENFYRNVRDLSDFLKVYRKVLDFFTNESSQNDFSVLYCQLYVKNGG